jgi:FtsP/CotA-like multicopper oxidase with cupredoxin domain
MKIREHSTAWNVNNEAAIVSIYEPDRRRRRFVQGLAWGGLWLAGGRASRLAIGGEAGSTGVASGNELTVLRGREATLEIGTQSVNFTGTARTATVVNGRIPAPLLYWREGDTVTVRVRNRLTVPTSIHWHGLLLPAAMDGVPGLSFDGIPPGETFTYRFELRQSGTYWYHSHSRFQEQVGLYGPIIIAPRDAERHAADREHVVLLSDWTDLDPEHIYRTLKRQSGYFNYGRRTVADFVRDARTAGLRSAIADRRMWGEMRMDPTDLLDVSGHAYTYLMNGTTPAGNWTCGFERGERVRLRIINGSSMSFFDFRIPDLKLTVVAADGQDIEPVTVDELRIGAAEVYDVLAQPRSDRAYTLFAQALDRSGYARGTLTPASGMQAEIPPLDPRPVLTMADVGMDMGGPPGGMSMDMGARAASDSFGPNVDMVAAVPATRLDDPGVGLRDNGRRVLTYADLHTIGGPLDERAPAREVRLHLTGHMQRFVWSFDGQKFSQSLPLRFSHGERLRIVLVNDTMMMHPIHLHGMWSEMESSPGGQFLVRKHTVIVQPGQQLSYAVTARPPGRWAFHCHLLYHMEAGMFREVVVA